jgi:hypothetical protein
MKSEADVKVALNRVDAIMQSEPSFPQITGVISALRWVLEELDEGNGLPSTISIKLSERKMQADKERVDVLLKKSSSQPQEKN